MNKICLIIPVYNEEENIQKLFIKIKKLKIKFDILFIILYLSMVIRNNEVTIFTYKYHIYS